MTFSRVVIDITFCGKVFSSTIHDYFCLMFYFEPVGDWAGSSYTTSGCPGTCSERLMDGANFEVRHYNAICYL